MKQIVLTPVTEVINGKNVKLLKQDMVKDSNTIYIIDDDLELNGGNISFANNTVLVFQGGSISNSNTGIRSTITLSKTKIVNYDMPVLKGGILLAGESEGNLLANIYEYSENDENGYNFYVIRSLYTVANYSNVDVVWRGVKKVRININEYSTPNTIRLGLNNDFESCEFVVSSNVDMFLFEYSCSNKSDDLYNVDNSNYTNKAAFLNEIKDKLISMNWINTFENTVPDLNNESCLILIADPDWTARNGYDDFDCKRRDLIYVNKGLAQNMPIYPYSSNSSFQNSINSEVKYVVVPERRAVIKNLTITRTSSQTATASQASPLPASFGIVKPLRVIYANNVLVSNVTLITNFYNKNQDNAFYVQHSANVVFRDINISYIYDSGGCGYGFGAYNVYNIQYENINTITKNWGVFGTNFVNKCSIRNSHLNRFDVHCYGRDILIDSCVCREVYMQESCMFGYWRMSNCTFFKSDANPNVLVHEYSYNADTKYDLIFENCEIFYNNNLNLYQNNILLGPEEINTREELSTRYDPNVYVNGLILHPQVNNSTVYIINTEYCKDFCHNIDIVSLKNIRVEGLSINLFVFLRHKVSSCLVDLDNVLLRSLHDHSITQSNKYIYSGKFNLIHDSREEGTGNLPPTDFIDKKTIVNIRNSSLVCMVNIFANFNFENCYLFDVRSSYVLVDGIWVSFRNCNFFMNGIDNRNANGENMDNPPFANHFENCNFKLIKNVSDTSGTYKFSFRCDMLDEKPFCDIINSRVIGYDKFHDENLSGDKVLNKRIEYINHSNCLLHEKDVIEYTSNNNRPTYKSYDRAFVYVQSPQSLQYWNGTAWVSC